MENNIGVDLDYELTLDSLMTQVQELESSLTTTTNIKQLLKVLNDIGTTQNDADSLMQLYSRDNNFQHQSTIRSLEISRVELSSTLNHSRNLRNIMENANSLSYKITERVRLLDVEKNYLIKVKNYVDHVKTLKLELSKAYDAIEREDWLIASKSIDIIRNLPEGLINDPYVEFKVPTSSLEDIPSDLISRWILKLEDIFVTEFNNAASKRDVNKLTYFFQLFPLIGKATVGLKCYSRFICGIISEQSRSIIRSVQNKESKPEFYAQLLFRLYQTISSIVNQHSKVIKLYYGKEVVNDILKDIQMECDLQSNLIFETYSDSKHLERIVDNVQQYGYPILIKEIYKNVTESESEEEDEEEAESVELIEISKVTDELSAMMNHWAMYSKFFVVVWNQFLDNPKGKDIYPLPLVLSSFGIKIHDKIIGQFDLFCTYTIRRTLEKACTIESLGSLLPNLSVCLRFLTLIFKKIENSTSHPLYTLIPEDPPISSLADDIIIVLNTILLEVLATGELRTIKNMVSNVKRILMTDFLNIIQQRLKSLSLKTTSNLLTKDTIQKIHQQQNPVPELPNNDSSVNSPSRSSTPVGINVSASDIANTGALFMRSLNAAISYTMASEGDGGVNYFTGDDTDIKQYVIYLNTLNMMNTYLEKLVDSCMKNVKTNLLLVVDDQELTKVRSAIDINSNHKLDFDITIQSDETIQSRIEGLLRSIPAGFQERSNSIIDSNIKLIFSRVIKTRVIKLLNDAIAESYNVTIEDGQYYTVEMDNNIISNGNSNNNLNNYNVVKPKEINTDDKIARFIKNWNSLIIPYVTTLSAPVFTKLITKIVELSSIVLENKIWQLESRVSEIGAVKIEQDISTIIQELTKFNYGLRSSFIKVTQIIMVVGLDEEEDIDTLEDIDKGVEWALTPSERTRARRLRC